eukprot:gene6609-7678_t
MDIGDVTVGSKRNRKSLGLFEKVASSGDTTEDEDEKLLDELDISEDDDSDWQGPEEETEEEEEVVTDYDDDDYVCDTDVEATPTKKKMVKERQIQQQQRIEMKKRSKSTGGSGSSRSGLARSILGASTAPKKKKERAVKSVDEVIAVDTSSWTSKPIKTSSEGATTTTVAAKKRVTRLASFDGPKDAPEDFFTKFLFKGKAKAKAKVEIDLLEEPIHEANGGSVVVELASDDDDKEDDVKVVSHMTSPKVATSAEKNKKKEVASNIDDDEDNFEGLEPIVVNKKRVNKRSPFDDTTPTKPAMAHIPYVSLFGSAMPIKNLSSKFKSAKEMRDEKIPFDVNSMLDDEDTEPEEEEEEESPMVMKRRVKSSVITDDEETEPEDVDVGVETHKPVKQHSNNKAAFVIEDDDEETEEEKEVVEVEEEEEEEEDDGTTQLEKLINACDSFSKRMLEILSTCDPTNSSQSESSDDLSHRIVSQPKLINRQMRSYQLIGLNWMALLYQEKISGILADEMGLGKTVQSISLLAHIYENFGDHGPHLIIVPATTLSNWQRELSQWCPTLKVFPYYGTAKERGELRQDLRGMKAGKDYNVIVTTYNILFNAMDRGFLKKINYSYLVLDEAQNIKNSDSKRYKNIFKIESKHRLLLTGTPLQNSLTELWSLLNFIMPHIFGNYRDNTMLDALEAQGQSTAISRMKTILSPFILRRLKSEVSLELKPKRELVEQCSMVETQEAFYKLVISQSRRELEEAERAKKEAEDSKVKSRGKASKGKRKRGAKKDSDEEDDDEELVIDIDNPKKPAIKTSGKLLNNILMQLRKTVNHPLLCHRFHYNDQQVGEIMDILRRKDSDFKAYNREEMVELFADYSDHEIHCIARDRPKLLADYAVPIGVLSSSSSKCGALMRLIEQHADAKILVFSQMTRVLDILEEVLDHAKIPFCRLDGQTPVSERQDIIDTFSNEADFKVFLLSTLAGGLGINLTCASVVIFYDISFNPQVDRQAEDRAHRLGQTREVIVYKLIMNDTVDTKILDLSNTKKLLNDSMLEEGSYASKEGETKLESKNIVKLLGDIFSI